MFSTEPSNLLKYGDIKLDQTLFEFCLTWQPGTFYVGVNMGRAEMWQTPPVISYVPVSGSYASTQVKKDCLCLILKTVNPVKTDGKVIHILNI